MAQSEPYGMFTHIGGRLDMTLCGDSEILGIIKGPHGKNLDHATPYAFASLCPSEFMVFVKKLCSVSNQLLHDGTELADLAHQAQRKNREIS